MNQGRALQVDGTVSAKGLGQRGKDKLGIRELEEARAVRRGEWGESRGQKDREREGKRDGKGPWVRT